MPVTITPASPRDPGVTRLLRQSHALMLSMYDPGACHFLDIDALCAPGITLYAAEVDGRTVGCVALKRGPEYGEVKSFFVDPDARGLGVGRALIAHLEAEARAEGLTLLRLETGVGLDAAQTLYRSFGYAQTGPFGAYEASPVSLFYEKRL
ncbi:GNAT family N-acetyltransferase [Thalassococcus sp. BH17M4-6]|uniref:GNAT family N-acetyltransferase n=1 Tax=Thalassococcus sp. BH17M4-6 TaxID=3413148 RepID=UPI003BEE10EA